MKYLICVTNRVGSSWLCSMLTSTGVAGHPVEHFNLREEDWPRFAAHYQAISTIDPLGIKTSYPSLMRAIAYVGFDEFRHAKCIWLRRKDTLAQAISNYRAMVTGQWVVRRNEQVIDVKTAPDCDLIRRLWTEYDHCNRVLWPDWFAKAEQEPLQIWYEDMCQDPEATVRMICSFLELPPPRQIDIGSLQVQRDGCNERWRETVLGTLGRVEFGT